MRECTCYMYVSLLPVVSTLQELDTPDAPRIKQIEDMLSGMCVHVHTSLVLGFDKLPGMPNFLLSYSPLHYLLFFCPLPIIPNYST